MESTNSEKENTLFQLVKANTNKRYWAESLLRMVRVAKNSRGEKRNRELARLESEIVQELTREQNDGKLDKHIRAANHDFVTKLRKHNPGLTENELLLSCLLRMELPPETIAFMKGISLVSLNVARSRLKTKLGLDEGVFLDEFLQQF